MQKHFAQTLGSWDVVRKGESMNRDELFRLRPRSRERRDCAKPSLR
ncbi:hypothetical protein RSSM_04506 [Rhodopirellula sallentina SM41]|uniref:Uncharacterized protein n=1 Tax=Rhodopirellula sallentina SM41 TaxID=1263870 RepID=M5TXZ6_9BACT|nr:hypothetical protein RSSM_04506 [Rhodopirellula sallentina SM41]